MAVAEWLSSLRKAQAGEPAILKLGKTPETKDDQQHLTSFLRYVRSCRALVIAEVDADASQLSWIDVVACLCADVTTAAEGQDDVCTIEAPASGEMPEAVVKKMWQDAVGKTSLEVCTYPKTLMDLRQAHLLKSQADVEALRRNSHCIMPQFLLGFRRAGGIDLVSREKSCYNFYWVTKVFMLEATLSASKPSEQPPQQSVVSKTISVSFDEEKGILSLELYAEVLDTNMSNIYSVMDVWSWDSRVKKINVVLPGADESWLGRLIPAEVIRESTSVFKWYRKWDNLFAKIAKRAPMQCEIRGPTAPALIELFFSASTRIWSWEGANVGFQSSGHLPSCMFFKMHHHLGRSVLRALLLQGLPPQEALKMGVVSFLSGDKIGASKTVHSIQGQPAQPILQVLQNRHVWHTPVVPQYKPRPVLAKLVGMSVTLPGKQHEMSQMQVCERLGLKGTPLQSLFEADHIQTRTLAHIGEHGFGYYSPEEIACGTDRYPPGQGVLTQKHLRWARALLADAVKAACQDAGEPLSAVRYISISSSSGYLLPGLTSYVIKDLGLHRGTVRCDIVGMGCHAGLNSLQAATNWAALHPGKLAISCGVEVLSAHFMWGDAWKLEKDDSHRLNHALCNSLFSDGCFAVALLNPTSDASTPCYATLHEFASQTVTDAMHTMTYQWNDEASQFWFNLSEEAPYAVGTALKQLLHDQQDLGLPMEQVLHYVMHTGGQTVMDAAAAALGVDDVELSPTKNALRKYGNNSSVSYMFAFSEFLESSPSPVAEGDLGVFITMGPGAGFELCLWSAGSRSASDRDRSLEACKVGRIADPPWETCMPGTKIPTARRSSVMSYQGDGMMERMPSNLTALTPSTTSAASVPSTPSATSSRVPSPDSSTNSDRRESPESKQRRAED